LADIKRMWGRRVICVTRGQFIRGGKALSRKREGGKPPGLGKDAGRCFKREFEKGGAASDSRTRKGVENQGRREESVLQGEGSCQEKKNP